MLPLLGGVVVLIVGGAGALLVQRSARWATFLGVGGAVTGCLAGVIPAGRALLGGPEPSLQIAWDVPYGAFFVQIDALSALFLLPLFGVSALAALYGAEYVLAGRHGGRPGTSWFFFDVLVASMVIVLVARNAVLFLVAWEIMALASFFLVTQDHDDEAVRKAGWAYLVASHLGTAWLLVLFILLGRGTGSLDFDRFGPAAGAGLLFVLAVIGFGTKAGFMPLHVWLPEAHPAAPSHVSAVMSAVMIKTGIYGLLRTLTFLGPLPAWAGWLLLAVGGTSGVLGVLLAIAQHDLKRLLAYSSVENVGIIGLGLGLGLVGLQAGVPVLAVLGFAGALLHVVNHAVFKGLLFLGAGAVLRATETRRIDLLGGILRQMPHTGTAVLAGAVAICGLPPLNGFVSEFLLFVGALGAATSSGNAAAIPALAVIAVLSAIGGLAVICFTGTFGIVFLGEARSGQAAHAREVGPCMRIPLQLLGAACLAIGLCSPLVVRALAPVVVQVTGLPPDVVDGALTSVSETLGRVTVASAVLLALVALAAVLRRSLLSRRVVTEADTWDCGYASPSPRMQYTASSFAQPLMALFGPLLGSTSRSSLPVGLFPHAASFASATPDPYRERFYRPVFTRIGRSLSAFRWVQHGRVQVYVLYIAFTLLVLFLWTLGRA